MQIPLNLFFDFFVHFFIVLTRVGSIFIATPVFSSQMLSRNIKIAFAVVLTLLIFPNVTLPDITELWSFNGILILICQLLVGLSLGFIWRILFEVFSFVGTFISMQMGLGFAVMNDPQTDVSVPMLAQLYVIAVTLLFLSTDLHLLIIKMILFSFDHIPIGANIFKMNAHDFIEMSAMLFSGAMSISLPAVIALLVVNFGFGLMSKLSPQLNIFNMGFSVTLIFGMIVVYFTFYQTIDFFETLKEWIIDFIRSSFFVSNQYV